MRTFHYLRGDLKKPSYNFLSLGILRSKGCAVFKLRQRACSSANFKESKAFKEALMSWNWFQLIITIRLISGSRWQDCRMANGAISTSRLIAYLTFATSADGHVNKPDICLQSILFPNHGILQNEDVHACVWSV